MATKAKKEKTKFKTILSDPYKKNYPVLDDNELKELKHLLLAAVESSGMNRSTFAAKCVRLGLESSLRAINNRKCAAVFISLSLNPKYIIGLIGRNVQCVDETTPVFAQPKLEEFTKDVFGIAAMILVLPLELTNVNCDLDQWVKKNKNIKKTIKMGTPKSSTIHLPKKKKKRQPTSDMEINQNETEPVKIITATTKHEEKFGDDFISFSSDNAIEINKLNLEEDKNLLLTTLKKITTVEKKKSEISTDIAMEIDEHKDIQVANELENEQISEDDFLDHYHPLTVYKIRPNPDKKPKKKRKKNKLKK